MTTYCQRCRTKVGLLRLRCPYCRESTVNLLHLIATAAVAVAAAFFLLR